MRYSQLLIATALLATACRQPVTANASFINKDGKTVQERFKLPDGYIRLKANGFGNYLRSVLLQTDGSAVHYYNGGVKDKDVHAAVVKMDIGNKNLQQCADAVMRLRAEYLYNAGLYDKIHFNFTNGFRADYNKWRQGHRIQVSGNKVSWVHTAKADDSYASFRQYLDMVFSYAGSQSLSKELQPADMKDMQPGDVLIIGGSPGHAVIVMDVAVNAQGKKLYLLAQSYMPAQEIEILKNPENRLLSPWYEVDVSKETIITPEYDFTIHNLKRFAD